MSFTSYHIPTNDAQMDEYSRAIPELATNNINMEYVDYWLNLTVEKEINRGARLAEEKLRLYPLSQDECGINIDFIKPIPTCSKIKRYCSHRKCSQRQYTDVRLHSCNRRQNSLYFEPNSCTPQSCYSKQNIAKLRPRIPRCPMRVAELAVPTKRQCIDTWRNKCDVLPEFMVERLKQQVMDEKPVVKISDALTCFKNRKSPFNRSRLKTCTIAAMNLRNEDFRKYSATFSHKIAQKLNIPFNITLNPQLEKISNVVSSDISRLTKHQKKINTKNAKNKKIQIEMSSKIAAWIANIVEESSYKMIEADLRELEEEEGPVLDFIDSLVHNVVSICEDFSEKDDLHPALYTNIASPVSHRRSGSVTGESEKVMERNDSIQTTSGEMESNVESSYHNKIEDNLELDSNEEYILEELERIVVSVTITAQPDKQNTIADMIKTEDYLVVDKMSRQSIDSTSSYVQFKQSNNSQGFVKEYQEFSENSKDADNNFSANQENDNVSELFQIHSEESPDVKSRKINFLQLIANKAEKQELKKQSKYHGNYQLNLQLQMKIY
ncbi:uncharacterized protein LOC131845940 [Achroia grisella]|uniref:uncharacterized protein LOC131845940 n=1 Tax=Achroia grisella TaxID=688607 RepID=UPI0027D2376A|nr:uncharacterized protein LOC131845940 [Achroia grisella]